MKTQTYFRTLVIAGFSILSGVSTTFAQADSNKLALSDFNTIVISAASDVKLVQGTENSISIKDGNINNLVTSEIKDHVLYVKKAKEDITISFVKLNKLELSGQGDVKSTTQITGDALEVALKGSASDVKLDVNVKNLTTTIEGAGDVEYKGTAENHKITISGAGDIDAYDLATNTTTIDVNGAGDAKLNVKQDLKGVINGAGEILYKEEPVTKDIKVNGVGSYGVEGSEISSVAGDTTKLKFGHKKVFIVGDESDADKKDDENKFKVYWAGVGIGVNGYLNANNETTVPAGYDFLDLNYAKSVNVSINLLEHNFQLWKNHINLVTGLGFDFANYKFDNKNYILQADLSAINGVYDSTIAYEKNKLTTTYLNVPLLLQFDTNPFGKKQKSTFHVSAGVVGSVKLGSHTKQVYEINDVVYKPKTKDDFNLSPFRYSAMVRVGVGKVDLYASYALNTLFNKGEGPQLYPFTVGLTLVGF
jgi:hypothetical protein